MLHKLEQVSSEGNIGTLAENLMEALRENKQVAAKVSVTEREQAGGRQGKRRF